MPRDARTRPPPPGALEELLRKVDADLQALLGRFELSPVEQEEVVHECVVALGFRWHGIQGDRAEWLLEELEAACSTRSLASSVEERSLREDGGED